MRGIPNPMIQQHLCDEPVSVFVLKVGTPIHAITETFSLRCTCRKAKTRAEPKGEYCTQALSAYKFTRFVNVLTGPSDPENWLFHSSLKRTQSMPKKEILRDL